MNNIIPMSKKEAGRLKLIEEIRAERLTREDAMIKEGVSERTVYRWIAVVAAEGPAGLVHGNRGRQSPLKVPDDEAGRITEIVRRTYLDCTAALIAEKLAERHGIDRDPKTVARILRDAKFWESPRSRRLRRTPVHRLWRERRARRGELVQFDGSYHPWLEGRGGTGEICLLAAIDDATGEIVQAVLADDEGVLPVMGFWLEYARMSGLPKDVYLDRFSTYKMSQEAAQLDDDLKTQLQRAMAAAGVGLIFARSPQAKGRVERLFRTLQDRLIKELRFAGIDTVEAANRFIREEFIPDFNRRFAVAARDGRDVHRPVSAADLAGLTEVFVRRSERVVLRDFTVSFRGQYLQILPTPRLAVRPRDVVEIREYPDGQTRCFIRCRPVLVRETPKRQEALARKIVPTLAPNLIQ